VLVGWVAVGWGVFGGFGGGRTEPVSSAPGASAVVTAAPSGVVSVAVPAASGSAGRAKAPEAPLRRQGVPLRGKLPF
jgi:hypothetical protein